MARDNGNEEACRSVKLRLATGDDRAFLLSLFASTRSDELALMSLDENQKRQVRDFIYQHYELTR